jgi:hypothetical protein
MVEGGGGGVYSGEVFRKGDAFILAYYTVFLQIEAQRKGKLNEV